MTVTQRRKRPKMGSRESVQIRSLSHLQWTRGTPCVLAITGDCDESHYHAHHVRLGTDGGTGLKPGDNWVVCLCVYHHRMVHDGLITMPPEWWRERAEDTWRSSPAGIRYRLERAGMEKAGA